MSDDLEARVDRMQRTQVWILAALLAFGVLLALLFILTVGDQGVQSGVAL